MNSTEKRNISFKLVSVIAGVMTAIIIHYTLYRLSLPVKPFVYVTF